MIFIYLIALVQADKQLSIIYPEDLASKFQTIDFMIADFGFVPYGQQFSGILELDDAINFCSQNEIESSDKSGEQDAKILVVLRGNCTFATKASNAQRSGYQMVMIVDNRTEELNTFFMISINYYEEIDIPVIMISKAQGDQIISYLQQAEAEKIKMYVSFPQFPKSQTITYTYRFDVMDQTSYQFFQQFYQFHFKMQDQLIFTPHYQVLQCDECRWDGFDKNNDNCLSGGRYCAPDPDGDGPMKGQDTMYEILRQICIHKYCDAQTFWKYILNFNQQCLITGPSIDCHNHILDVLNINGTQIDQCINASFIGNNFQVNDNTILANEYNSQYAVRMQPQLYINDMLYYGSLTVQTYIENNEIQDLYDTDHYGPLQAICRSFTDEDIPEICKQKLIGYMDKSKWVLVYLIKIENNSLFGPWIVWLIVIGASIIWIIIVICWYKRTIRRQQNVETKQEFQEQQKGLKRNVIIYQWKFEYEEQHNL